MSLPNKFEQLTSITIILSLVFCLMYCTWIHLLLLSCWLVVDIDIGLLIKTDCLLSWLVWAELSYQCLMVSPGIMVILDLTISTAFNFYSRCKLICCVTCLLVPFRNLKIGWDNIIWPCIPKSIYRFYFCC